MLFVMVITIGHYIPLASATVNRPECTGTANVVKFRIILGGYHDYNIDKNPNTIDAALDCGPPFTSNSHTAKLYIF